VNGQRLLDLEPAQVKRVYGVNSLAHFWTVKCALPSMIKSPVSEDGPSLIVTVASVVILPIFMTFCYCMIESI